MSMTSLRLYERYRFSEFMSAVFRPPLHVDDEPVPQLVRNIGYAACLDVRAEFERRMGAEWANFVLATKAEALAEAIKRAQTRGRAQ